MAFTNANLHLRGGAAGDLAFTYDAGSDTMAQVLAAGYFDNTDDLTNFTADDVIFCECADGSMMIRVSAVTSGDVAVQFVSGNMPIQTYATGTADALTKLGYGFYEVGTSVATATRAVLPTPYPGAVVRVLKVGSGTEIMVFDAGASASDVSLGASGAAAGGGTGVTYDAIGNRRITLRFENEGFHVVGSSTSRWRVQSMFPVASVVMEGGSGFLAGT